MILDHIMGAIPGLKEDALPCEYFDLIGGTSTGGLIAIMLGRLRMSVRDCINVFQELGEHVFSSNFLQVGANLMSGHRFPADKLENAVKQTVWAFSECHSKETIMKDYRDDACKTFVVAIPGLNVDAPVKRFRTYDNPSAFQSADTCMIWEAARATACAPSFFPEIQIPAVDGIVYSDGALGYNNPVQQVLSEARSLWGNDCDISCLLSIGTGHITKEMHTTESLLDLFQILRPVFKLATDCERIHQETQQEHWREGYYYRFNLPLKHSIALHEWERMEKLKKLAEEYALQHYSDIEECAERLL
ncbi:hypothetical protein FRC02_005522 [Tulasnella sp. 418]|nr:hypothetical protein FRC02_005522 [Tulasnella sp. 418]